MESELITQLTLMNQKLDALIYLKDMVEKHNDVIFGNGKEGMLVRVDRIEQRALTNRWLAGTSFVAFLGVIVEWLKNKIV